MLKNTHYPRLYTVIAIQAFLFIVCLNTFFIIRSSAQNNSPSSNATNTTEPNKANNNPAPDLSQFETIGTNSYLSQREYQLSLLVAVLTFITLLMICILFFKARSYKPEQILPSFAVVLIIGTALILVTSGYSSSEIAPVIGLFGTIAGYLIGKGQSSEQQCPHKAEITTTVPD